MRLRHAGTCRICDAALPANTGAVYERATGTVRCLTHDQHVPKPGVEVDIGEAGSSSLRSETCQVLRDRRIPGSRANIDHLAVTPTGVHVIDAKRYNGRPQLHPGPSTLTPSNGCTASSRRPRDRGDGRAGRRRSAPPPGRALCGRTGRHSPTRLQLPDPSPQASLRRPPEGRGVGVMVVDHRPGTRLVPQHLLLTSAGSEDVGRLLEGADGCRPLATGHGCHGPTLPEILRPRAVRTRD